MFIINLVFESWMILFQFDKSNDIDPMFVHMLFIVFEIMLCFYQFERQNFQLNVEKIIGFVSLSFLYYFGGLVTDLNLKFEFSMLDFI